MHTENAGKSQSGISIVEALVTMVILLIVMGGVYQIFQSNSLTYRMQQGMSRLQENGRFAMDFLVNDARMAGYLGCISSLQPNILLDPDNFGGREIIFDFEAGMIEGFSGTSTITYPLEDMTPAADEWSSVTRGDLSLGTLTHMMGIPGASPLPGSDILTLRFASDPTERILANTSTVVNVDEDSGFEPCDIVIANDCASADIFQIVQASTASGVTQFNVEGTACDSSPGPGNIDAPLLIRNPEALLMSIASVSFYVAMNSAGQPALYRKVGTAPSQELVEGVEAMKIIYGLDTNNDFNVDSYVGAATVNDWGAVRSLRIALLMRSPEEIRGMEPNADTYALLGSTMGPANDRRLRRVFEASVGIRNRLQ